MMLIDDFNVKPDVTDKVSSGYKSVTVTYVHGLGCFRMIINQYTRQLLMVT